MKKENESSAQSTVPVTRRRFIRDSAVAGAAVATSFPSMGRSFGQAEEIRVGVIGCGGRGTGAALNVLRAETKVIYPPPRNGWHTEDAVAGARAQAENVRVVALADMFRDRLDHCGAQLEKVGNRVEERHCFTGFDAYERLLDLDEVNYVILATPPHFRPRELRAAVERGKHVFMEKPVAVDSPGVRSILESGKMAAQKGLGIVAGTQRRHQADNIETVRRLQEGAIGEILEARAYFNIGNIWMIPRQDAWSDMEWQLRNWNYFTWLSGDIIVEQHIHMLDLINWILQSHPVRAYGMGGRQSFPSREFGHIFDHFFIEYEYENGARLYSQNRQIEGCANRVTTALLGRDGTSNGQNEISGSSQWKYQGNFLNPYEQEHIDLIESIRQGRPLNEARTVAESTLTAIMGRESAYSGEIVEWDAALASERTWAPDRYEFGDLPFPEVVNQTDYQFR